MVMTIDPTGTASCVGNTVRVLELMSAYVDEKEFTVWETLVNNLSILSHLLAHTLTSMTSSRNLLKRYFTMW